MLNQRIGKAEICLLSKARQRLVEINQPAPGCAHGDTQHTYNDEAVGFSGLPAILFIHEQDGCPELPCRFDGCLLARIEMIQPGAATG